MIYLEKKHFKEIVEHCQKEYSKEACGILAGEIHSEHFGSAQCKFHHRKGKVTKIYQMKNISENPASCYFMDPKEQLKVFKEMRKLDIEMLSVYHSHIDAPAYPSGKDMELAFYPEVVHMIISLQNINQPLVRGFRIIENKIEEVKIVVRKNILFICIENSCRSQIVEGIVNKLYWQKFAAYSAGSKPLGIINPKAQEVMKEIGIDISEQKSKGFTHVKDTEFDYVITLDCGEVYPVYPAQQKLNWQIGNPKSKSIKFFRKIRDEIQGKIQELAK